MQQNSFSLTGLVPLLLALAGMVTLNFDTLRSSRPPTPVKSLLTGLEDPQSISALLWQDPLTAVENTQETSAIQVLHPLDCSCGCKLPPEELPPVQPKILILPVFVNGGTFAEQVEGRSRARKSLVEALGSCNFSPKYREHLGCYVVPWEGFADQQIGGQKNCKCDADTSSNEIPVPAQNPSVTISNSLGVNVELNTEGGRKAEGGASARELKIPFEWYSRGTYSNAKLREFFGTYYPANSPSQSVPLEGSGLVFDKWTHVLVLWLRSDAFGDAPLTRLNDLVGRITTQEKKRLYEYLNPDKPVGSTLDIPTTNCEVRILGPSSSTGLVKMVRELSLLKPAPVDSEGSDGKDPPPSRTGNTPWGHKVLPWLKGARFFSAIATSPTQHIAHHARAGEDKGNHTKNDSVAYVYELFNEAFFPAQSRLEDKTVKSPGALVRTVATDDQTCRALLRELERRGVQLTHAPKWRSGFNKGPDHLAIISEWDTEYGRSLPYVFATEATKLTGSKKQDLPQLAKAPTPGPDNNATHRGNWPQWIHTFTYLQGLDGRTVEPAKSKSPTTLTDLASYAEVIKNTQPSEGVAGPNQADYLRRLAASLAARDRELRRTSGRGIRAVGVLGSDVYDKLMILRALKVELPDMLYFTNNLDAQLFHKDELPATRNLIIASPYGLRLHPSYQGAVATGWGDAVNVVAPFRDTYQTAGYAGMLTLLGTIPDILFPRVRDTTAEDNRGEPHYPENPLPRLFEIGRYGPCDISLTEPIEGNRTHQLHPERADLQPINILPWHSRLTAWGWGGVTLALIAVYWTYATGCHIEQSRFERSNKLAEEGAPVATQLQSIIKWSLMGLIVSEILFFVIRCTMPDWGEPFSRTSGTSLWPVEALRLIAILLAGHFIFQIQKIMLRNYNHISNTFFTRSQRKKLSHALNRHKLPFWRNPWKRTKKGLALTLQELKQRWQKPAADTTPAPAANRSPAPSDSDPEDDLEDVDVTSTRPQDHSLHDPARLWSEHLEEMRPSRRGVRWFISAILYTVTAFILLRAFDEPPARYRGAPSQIIDTLFTWLSLFTLAYVSFGVADILRQGAYLIRRLNHGTTDWHPDLALRKECPHDDAGFGGVAEWLDMKFMVARTTPVGRLTMYPIWLLTLLLVARLPCFDKFSWSLPNLLALSGCVLYACFCAVRLRSSADEARNESLTRLTRLQVAASKLGDEIQTALGKIATDFRNESGGAFASLTQQPFVRLIMWLVSAFGLGSLAAYLSVVLG